MSEPAGFKATKRILSGIKAQTGRVSRINFKKAAKEIGFYAIAISLAILFYIADRIGPAGRGAITLAAASITGALAVANLHCAQQNEMGAAAIGLAFTLAATGVTYFSYRAY